MYNNNFCGEYKVNQADNAAKIPGIMYGRYKNDNYGGGNPWVLSTGGLADLFYRAALHAQEEGANFSLTASEASAWKAVLTNLGDKPTADEFKTVLTAAGDAVMTRLHHHVKDDGFHLAE